MDILLQSDGQLYPPRPERKKTPAPKPTPPPPPKPEPPCPPPEPLPPPSSASDRSYDELLLLGIAFLILRSSEKPDIPLLFALAYILFGDRIAPKLGGLLKN